MARTRTAPPLPALADGEIECAREGVMQYFRTADGRYIARSYMRCAGRWEGWDAEMLPDIAWEYIEWYLATHTPVTVLEQAVHTHMQLRERGIRDELFCLAITEERDMTLLAQLTATVRALLPTTQETV